jgi:hypothetical protein
MAPDAEHGGQQESGQQCFVATTKIETGWLEALRQIRVLKPFISPGSHSSAPEAIHQPR